MNALPEFGLSESQVKAIRNHLINFEKSLSEAEIKLLKTVSPYTMLPPSRIIDAYHSARQAALRYPHASVVEFGVFGGGGLISLAYGAASINAEFSGRIVGFDTFDGHLTRPNEDEIDLHGRQQTKVFDEIVASKKKWAACSLDQVKLNFSTAQQLLNASVAAEFIMGDACETSKLIYNFCDSVSLLRLDMDWYDPTAAALEAVAPILTRNAIIIVDDYGHHSGVRQAVDKFFKNFERRVDYVMIDYACKRFQLLD